ncbi:MAG: TonB-dependent receptor family protein [Psychrobium sp.]
MISLRHSLLTTALLACFNASADDIESITVLGKSAVANASHGGIDVKLLPINVHVVNRDEIERIRFVDPNELLDRIPGETQVRNLRIPNGSKGYTLVLVDGMPIENPYGGATSRLTRLNTADIERVEIYKGPSSALFGNNAFGGVVNLITRGTPTEYSHKMHVESGDHGRVRYGIDSEGLLGDVGYVFNANSRKIDGLRAEGKDDKDQLSSKFSYDFNDNTSLIARVEYLDEDTVTRGDLTAEQIGDDKTQAGSLSSSELVKQSLAAFKLTHEFDDATLEVSLANRLHKAIGVSRYRGPKDTRDRGIMAKINYLQQVDSGNFVVGSEHYNGNEDVKAFGRKDLAMTGAYTSQFNEFEDLAFFYQQHWKINNQWSLDAGARYEKISLAATQGGERQRVEFDDLSPKLGVSYQLNSDNRLWLGLSQGFYAPHLDDVYSTDADSSNPNLSPEKSNNIELGLRGHIGNFSYDSSLYVNRISDYLVEQEFVRGDGSEYQRVTNAGEVSIRGLETVLEYRLHQDWRVSLTHTYTDNTYDKFVQSTVGASDDLSGKVLRRSPAHHYNARIAWNPLEGLNIELEGDFYSSYFSDHQNSPESKFTRDERINLRVNYQYNEHWKFWINGLNLTDTLEDRATYSRGKMKFRTIDGRTLYAGLSYEF